MNKGLKNTSWEKRDYNSRRTERVTWKEAVTATRQKKQFGNKCLLILEQPNKKQWLEDENKQTKLRIERRERFLMK